MDKLTPKYITDESGRRTAVVLSIKEFSELMEDLHDLAVLAERRDDPLIPHEEVVKQLRQDGYLQD